MCFVKICDKIQGIITPSEKIKFILKRNSYETLIPTTISQLLLETLPLDLPTLSVATATAMHGLPWCPHLESQVTMIDSSHVFSITRVTLTTTSTVAIDDENETHKKAFTRKDLVEDLVQVKDC